jgi:hypothetical protein
MIGAAPPPVVHVSRRTTRPLGRWLVPRYAAFGSFHAALRLRGRQGSRTADSKFKTEPRRADGTMRLRTNLLLFVSPDGLLRSRVRSLLLPPADTGIIGRGSGAVGVLYCEFVVTVAASRNLPHLWAT